MSGCTDCADQKRLAELTEPQSWRVARYWYATSDFTFEHEDVTIDTRDLPPDPLGYVSVREDGTTDWGSHEHYELAWRGTPNWRLHALPDSAKEDAEQKRPGSIFRRGRLVPDPVMARVTAEMSEYQRSVSRG